MILNDDECRDIYNTAMEAPVRSAVSVTRAIEQAVIRKLAAGVSVEPIAEVMTLHYGSEHPPVAFTGVVLSDTTAYHKLPFKENARLYTLDQLTTATAAARVQENERCLAMMDAIGCDWRDAGDMAKFYAANYLREAIRALLGKEAKS